MSIAIMPNLSEHCFWLVFACNRFEPVDPSVQHIYATVISKNFETRMFLLRFFPHFFREATFYFKKRKKSKEPRIFHVKE